MHIIRMLCAYYVDIKRTAGAKGKGEVRLTWFGISDPWTIFFCKYLLHRAAASSGNHTYPTIVGVDLPDGTSGSVRSCLYRCKKGKLHGRVEDK